MTLRGTGPVRARPRLFHFLTVPLSKLIRSRRKNGFLKLNNVQEHTPETKFEPKILKIKVITTMMEFLATKYLSCS